MDAQEWDKLIDRVSAREKNAIPLKTITGTGDRITGNMPFHTRNTKECLIHSISLDFNRGAIFFSLLALLALAGCAIAEPTPTTIPTPTPTTAPTSTPDPCTGWGCTVTGVVYADAPQEGNELQGATVTLNQSSYCSRTRGLQETKTGPDGRFEFGDVFLHDTDRIRIAVEFEDHEAGTWDSLDRYCFYCQCFAEPLEIVLPAAPAP
jgi:hypothetical protein